MEKRNESISEWTWEDWVIVEHALGELLHIGARYECFDKEYLKRVGELLDDARRIAEMTAAGASE